MTTIIARIYAEILNIFSDGYAFIAPQAVVDEFVQSAYDHGFDLGAYSKYEVTRDGNDMTLIAWPGGVPRNVAKIITGMRWAMALRQVDNVIQITFGLFTDFRHDSSVAPELSQDFDNSVALNSDGAYNVFACHDDGRAHILSFSITGDDNATRAIEAEAMSLLESFGTEKA